MDVNEKSFTNEKTFAKVSEKVPKTGTFFVLK